MEISKILQTMYLLWNCEPHALARGSRFPAVINVRLWAIADTSTKHLIDDIYQNDQLKWGRESWENDNAADTSSATAGPG